MSGPCSARSERISSAAAEVTFTRDTSSMGGSLLRASKEAHRPGVVADEQVLGLLIVIEHHAVILAPDARLLVAAEGGVRRIQMIAVGPDAAGLQLAAGGGGGGAVRR